MLTLPLKLIMKIAWVHLDNIDKLVVVVFDVAVSLPLFIFVLSCVLLRFVSFILSIISFYGFGKVISLAYF